jgi:hypothetical protein
MWQMCYNEPRLGGALRTVFRIRTKKKAATSSQAMVPWRQAQPVWAITTTLAGVHTGAQFRWYRSNAALPEMTRKMSPYPKRYLPSGIRTPIQASRTCW